MSQQGHEFMDDKKRISGKWPWKFTKMCKSWLCHGIHSTSIYQLQMS